jgi:CubicO group peptidase (beta-lactamase class C family)
MAVQSTFAISGPRVRVAEDLLRTGLSEGLFTHATYALALNGSVQCCAAFGKATQNTIYDLASLTKPMATAVMTMQLVEDGQIHLHQPLDTFFTEEYGLLPHLTDIELRHLLTHTSGLPPLPRWPIDASGQSRSDLIRSALSTPTLRQAGVGYTYSDTGYILLGEVVSRVAGAALNHLFLERVAGPLGLKNTSFLPGASVRSRIAPTCLEPGPGTVHDPRSRGLGGVAGHAGLFGVAEEVVAFAEAIRKQGGGILSRASAARLTVSQIDKSAGSQSFGFFCAGNDYLPCGDLFSPRSFGHSGFTGTLMLIDPEYEISLVLLTNRVINEKEDGSRFLRMRRYWLNAMAAAIV